MIGKAYPLPHQKHVNKYSLYDYWHRLLDQDAEIWEGCFLNRTTGPHGIFVYTALIDSHKDFLKSRWIFYPDIQSALGFIQHVFLPSSYFTLLDDHAEGFNTPMADVPDLLGFLEHLKPHRPADFDLMAQEYDLLRQYWDLPQEESPAHLKQFANRFNRHWCHDPEKTLYFMIFTSAEEVCDYILQGGEGEDPDFADVLKWETGLDQEAWYQLAHDAQQNPLLLKKFLTHLNYDVGCLV